MGQLYPSGQYRQHDHSRGDATNNPELEEALRLLSSAYHQGKITAADIKRFALERIGGKVKKKRSSSPGREIIECAYCHGLGHNSAKPCPVCGGARKVSVPKNSTESGNCYGLGHTF